MIEWWQVAVVLILAVLVGLSLTNRQRQRRRERGQAGAVAGNRNYVDEREDTRQAGMSAEDRAWEQASQQRNRDAQARRQSHAGAGPGSPTSSDRGADQA